MLVRLLGPIDIVVDGVPRAVPGSRRRAVLAVLALYAGETVSVDLLVDAVWGEAPPSTVVNALQRHVSSLRQALGSKSALLSRTPGYVLDVETDLAVAEQEVRDGERAPDPAERAWHLRAALDRWRGPSLADVRDPAWLAAQANRLDRLRLRAAEVLVEARLALGEHASLVPDLEASVAARPFDERAHGHLMLALYRAGRQADALAVYRRLRETLDDDLGIEPGQPLRDLEGAILRQDGSLEPAPVALAARGTATVVPAQLPPAVPAFAGRVALLAQLDALAADGGRPVAVVSGAPGIGKTTLAVQWAHRAAARFPDGQLYVNLRGYDPARPAMDPGEAVRGFLDAWGVPAGQVPVGVDGRVALFRSLLAGRRVLVVLDNALDADQVRPLLPGAPGCVTVVTSRNRLEPLVATGGALPLTLDLLTTNEARELLAGRLGPDRLAAEPDAVAEIVRRCARLPLALAIVAARAATHPDHPLSALAGELNGAANLDVLRAGDTATDVRAVFSWSYRALGRGAARLFRLLGLHPGPDLSASAAASLAGACVAEIRPLLAELAAGHLVTEPTAGRYACHDLLRAFAADLGRATDGDGERRAATHRLLDGYLHTAHAAALALDPHRDAPTLAPVRAGAVCDDVADHASALAWLGAERATLLAAVDRAAVSGFDTHVWQLAWALSDVLDRQGHWQDGVATQQAAVAAARRLADPVAQARAHRLLARTFLRLRRYRDAYDHLWSAVELSAVAGDRVGQAHTHLNLSEAYARGGATVGGVADALHHARRALDLFRIAGHRPGQTLALNAVGWFQAQLGDHRQAVDSCRQALALAQETGDRPAEAATWDSLGLAYRELGEHDEAVRCYEHAIAWYAELGDRYEEATSLGNLADAYADLRPDAALTAGKRALAILDELGHPDADVLRERLSAMA